MNENLVQTMIELKARYFGSKYFSIRNWMSFNHITLPGNIKIEDIEGWAEEKQSYKAKEKVYLDGIQSTYEQMIIDRLDTATALQEKVIELLSSIEDSKDAREIAQTMEKVATIQDEAMKLLKVDSFRSNLYEKNKSHVDDLLKENKKGIGIEVE